MKKISLIILLLPLINLYAQDSIGVVQTYFTESKKNFPIHVDSTSILYYYSTNCKNSERTDFKKFNKFLLFNNINPKVIKQVLNEHNKIDTTSFDAKEVVFSKICFCKKNKEDTFLQIVLTEYFTPKKEKMGYYLTSKKWYKLAKKNIFCNTKIIYYKM